MSSYLEKALTSGEVVKYRASLSAVPYYFNLVALVLAPGTLGAVFLISWAWYSIDNANTDLVITNKRVIAKFGIFRRKTLEMNLAKIESIAVLQGVIGRLFNYGAIIVIGTGGTKEIIPRISKPLEFRREYSELQGQ